MATKTKKTRSALRSSSNSEAPSFEWKEPPILTRGRGRAFNFPEEKLKSKKGTWALVKTTEGPARSACSYLKKQLERRQLTGFEVISRGSEVFARFVGGGK